MSNNNPVETIAIEESKTEKLVKRTILLTALLITIPLFLLILLFTDDPMMNPGRRSSGSAAQKVSVTALGGMDFAPVKLKQIESTQELLENLVISVNLVSGNMPSGVYLRAGSFETYTATSMKSHYSRLDGKSWPDFAFEKVPGTILQDYKKAYLNFHKNFEGRLPHPPVISRLAGPLKYRSMSDGSLIFDYTIAVGDEFEVEYLQPEVFSLQDEIENVGKNSPYLSLDGLDRQSIRELANKAAPVKVGAEEAPESSLEHITDPALRKMLQKYDSVLNQQSEETPEPETVLALKKFLETNGVYKPDYSLEGGSHPVEEFLNTDLKGHCQLFAAGLVALCRSRRIPSRVGTGYYTDYSKDQKFLVTNAMAHAWPEILTKKGWKIVDISPLRSEMPPVVKSEVMFPTDEQLKKFTEQAVRAEMEQVEPGEVNFNDADAIDRGAMPRNQLSMGDDRRYSPCGKPGSVIRDEERQKEYQQKVRKHHIKKLIRFILNLLLLGSFLFFAWKYGEDFLKWLMKLLKKKEKEEIAQEEERTQAQSQFNQLLEKLAHEDLSGEDLAEVFMSFSRIMAASGKTARAEHQTAKEYLEKLCLEYNIRPADGLLAATLLESEVYGMKTIERAKFEKFCSILQSILSR